jgi:hypothetical protein
MLGAMSDLPTTPEGGLDPAEAARRLAAEGPNVVARDAPKQLWRLIFELVTEPMIALLVILVIIYLVLGELREAIAMSASVLAIIFLTLFQEWRTEKAVAALRDLASPRALVVRGGERLRIPSAEVVARGSLGARGRGPGAGGRSARRLGQRRGRGGRAHRRVPPHRGVPLGGQDPRRRGLLEHPGGGRPRALRGHPHGRAHPRGQAGRGPGRSHPRGLAAPQAGGPAGEGVRRHRGGLVSVADPRPLPRRKRSHPRGALGHRPGDRPHPRGVPGDPHGVPRARRVAHGQRARADPAPAGDRGAGLGHRPHRRQDGDPHREPDAGHGGVDRGPRRRASGGAVRRGRAGARCGRARVPSRDRGAHGSRVLEGRARAARRERALDAGARLPLRPRSCDEPARAQRRAGVSPKRRRSLHHHREGVPEAVFALASLDEEKRAALLETVAAMGREGPPGPGRRRGGARG